MRAYQKAWLQPARSRGLGRKYHVGFASRDREAKRFNLGSEPINLRDARLVRVRYWPILLNKSCGNRVGSSAIASSSISPVAYIASAFRLADIAQIDVKIFRLGADRVGKEIFDADAPLARSSQCPPPSRR
jgi:hypothetical protein